MADGLFDDLLPAQARPADALFDDLVPQKAPARAVTPNAPGFDVTATVDTTADKVLDGPPARSGWQTLGDAVLALPTLAPLRGALRVDVPGRFQRGAAGQVAGALHSGADFLDQTIQQPLRSIAAPLLNSGAVEFTPAVQQPRDLRTEREQFSDVVLTPEQKAERVRSRAVDQALGLFDPLGAAAVADEAKTVQQMINAERAIDDLAIPRPSIETWLTDPEYAFELQTARTLGQGAEAAPAVVGALATRSPTAGSAVLGGLAGAEEYGSLRAQGVDRIPAVVGGLGTAATEGAGELVGLPSILKPGGSVLRAGLENFAQEFPVQLAQDNLAMALQGGDIPILGQLANAFEAGATGLTIGAAGRTATGLPEFLRPNAVPTPVAELGPDAFTPAELGQFARETRRDGAVQPTPEVLRQAMQAQVAPVAAPAAAAPAAPAAAAPVAAPAADPLADLDALLASLDPDTLAAAADLLGGPLSPEPAATDESRGSPLPPAAVPAEVPPTPQAGAATATRFTRAPDEVLPAVAPEGVAPQIEFGTTEPPVGKRKWVDSGRKDKKGRVIYRPTVDYRDDGLLEYLAAAGGLNFEDIRREGGADPALLRDRTVANPLGGIGFPALRKTGGLSLDQLTEAMIEDGWFGPIDPDAPPTVANADVVDRVMEAINGRPVYHPSEGHDARAARDRGRIEAEESFDDFVETMQSDAAAHAQAVQDLRAQAIEVDDADAAEAAGLVELATRARDAGIDEFDLQPFENEAGADYARRLWTLTREASRAPDQRATPEDRPGRVPATFGLQAPAAAAETAPARAPAQVGLFGAPSARETVDAEARRRDAERSGQTGSGRTDMLSGGGELFAGPRPQQATVAEPLEATDRAVDLSRSTTGFRSVTLGDTTIDYGVSRDGQTAEIINVRTPPASRGQGSARAALEQVIAEADRQGVTLFLTAEPLGKGGPGKAQLETFYKSLGFRPNKGRRKDFRSQQGMVRDPQGGVESTGRAYPLAPAGTRYQETDIAPTMMSPDEFLSRVRPLDIDEASRDNIDDLKRHIEAGRPLDPLHIYADGREDGRHRAVAAKELGITQVPVIVHGEQGRTDEATGLPLNADGTVTVYHHTNKQAADDIRRTGRLRAAAEPDVYVTTRRETDTGYGDTAVAIRVKPDLLQLDDEFPDGRRDFRLTVGRPGGSVAVQVDDNLREDVSRVTAPAAAQERSAEESRMQGEQDADANGLREAVTKALGRTLGPRVEYLRGLQGLPENLRRGIEARQQQRGGQGRTAAVYDPDTRRVFIFTDVVTTPERAVWNAAHEIAGHEGLRVLLGDKLDHALNIARQNPTVKAVADAIAAERKLRGDQGMLATEEALAELAAATRTGNFDEIASRYGVTVPDAVKPALQQAIANFLKRLKAAIEDIFGRPGFTDEDVRDLLEAAWQAANDGPTLADTVGTGQSVDATAPEQTQTAAFKRWFGDSKVVDENGKPLVVYHGSPKAEIDRFEAGAGAFFTADPKVAEDYTGRRGMWRSAKTGSIYPVYLSLQNPLVLDARGQRNDNIPVPWQQWKPKVFGNLPKGAANMGAVIARAKEMGHDGVIVRNVMDTADVNDRRKSDVLIAFAPEQIKSATANRGTFDPASPSILENVERMSDAQQQAQAERLPADATGRSIVASGNLVPFLSAAKQAGADLTGIRDALAQTEPQARARALVQAIDALLPLGTNQESRQAPITNRAEPTQEPPIPAAQPTDAPKRTTTGTQNAVVRAERDAAGKDPIVAAARQSNESTLAQAEEVLQRTPERGAELVEQLAREGVASVSAVDEAVLLIHKAQLRAARDRAADRASAPELSDDARAVAERQWRELESQLNEVDQATFAAGREWGRMGQFRQRMLRDDFTLEALERKERAREGRPLTREETARLKDFADRIAEKQKQFDALQARIANAETEHTYESLIQAMAKARPAKARPTLDKLRAAANESRAFLAGLESIPSKKGQAGATLDPRAFYHLTRIGAYHVANGAATFADWAAKMRADLGARLDEFREALPAVFRASKAQAKDVGTGASVAEVLAGIDEAPTGNDVRKLAEAHIRAGVRGEGPVMAAVHASLAPQFPNLSERDVRRLFSDYGKATFPSQDAVKAEIRQLRALVQLQESIDRLQAGLPALKSGPQRDKATQSVREKRVQLNELLKTLAQDAKTPEQLASYNDARVRNLKHQIEDLEKQIATGERPEKRTKPTPSPEVQELIARRDALRAERDALDRKPADPEARYQAQRGRGIQKRIDELQERIRSGDFAKRPRVPRALNEANERAAFELDQVKEEFARHQFEAELAKRTPLGKVFGGAKDTINFARALMTSLDLSGVLRQGGFISYGHPVQALKALGPSLKAFASEQAEHAVKQDIQRRPNAPLYKKAGLEFTGIGSGPLNRVEEAYASRWVDRFPKVLGGGLIRGSGRSYTTFLNRLRADAFDAMAASLSRTAKPTAEEAKAIANYINVATGRGKVGTSANAGEALNTLFFAPRLVASRFQLLAGQPLYGGSNRTRKLIAQEYARFLLGVGTATALAAFGGDADEDEQGQVIELDPRSSNFGKFHFGNTYLDPLAGLAQVTTLVGRLATGETKSGKGVIKPLRASYTLTDLRRALGEDLEPHKLAKDGSLPFGSGSASDVIGRFLRTKLAPVPGAAVNTLAGEDVIGQPVTPAQTAASLVTPMSFSDVAAIMEEQGVPKGTAIMLAGLLGMGVQHREQAPAPEPSR